MPTRLQPNAFDPSYFIATTIGNLEVKYRLRFVWRGRMNAWYVDLYDADGNRIVVGRRLSPRATPWSNFEVEGLPESFVYVSGPDAYLQGDLGGALIIQTATDEEIAELNAQAAAEAA